MSLSNNRENVNWVNVTSKSPCPVCGNTGWCSITECGSWCACRRQDKGSVKTKTDKSGVPFHLHRLKPTLNGPPEAIFLPTDTKSERADPAILDKVYRKLLENLPLYDKHVADMEKRGLKKEGVTTRKLVGGLLIRSLGRERAEAVDKVIAAGFEKHLPAVPGYYIKQDEAGRRYWSLAGPGGLLIPVFNADRQIVALQIRPDKPLGDAKYLYLSSKKKGGVGPGSPINVPLYKGGDLTTVRLTEGNLKCLIAFVLSKIMTIGLPSASATKGVVKVLRKLGAKTVRVALDADARTNLHVAKGLARLVRMLKKAKFTVELEVWPLEFGKGIDDVLAAGKEPRVLAGDEVPTEIKAILVEAKKSVKTAKPGSSPALGKSGEHNSTDLGNARRVVDLHGQDIRYCHPWEKWLLWNNLRWLPDDTAEVTRRVKDTQFVTLCNAVDKLSKATSQEEKDKAMALLEHCLAWENTSKIEACLKSLRSEPVIPILPAQLDTDTFALNVLNGTINLRTGELRPHCRGDYLTKLAPVEFNPDAKCPLWLDCLHDWMMGKSPLVEYLQRVIGYTLTGACSEQAMWFLYGGGQNGKTVFLRCIQDMLGDYSATGVDDLLLQKKHQAHPTELATLFGKRFVATIEQDQGRKLAEALMKKLTGEDVITARRMREDFWDFSPTHKLFLAANHKPEVRGQDKAVWRRIKLVPFLYTVPEAKKDKNLVLKLKAEWPGIMAWAVQGCLHWQRSGICEPKDVTDATDEYRAEQDLLGEFLSECCTIIDSASVRSGVLLEAFQKWARQDFTRNAFCELMEAHGYRTVPDSSNCKAYKGIGLNWAGGAGDLGDLSN